MYVSQCFGSIPFPPSVPELAVPAWLTAVLGSEFVEQLMPKGLKQQLTDREPRETLSELCRRHKHLPGQRSIRGLKATAALSSQPGAG